MSKVKYPSAIELIIGALTISVALAWNDAVKTMIENWIKPPSEEVLAAMLFAATITFILVILVFALKKLKFKAKKIM